MMKKSSKYYLLSGIILSIIGVLLITGYAVAKEMKTSEEQEIKYVSYEILTDNIMPVSKEITDNTFDISRPYNDVNIEIGKSYYDISAEEKEQENSIIYYENTYMQNTGTDYILKGKDNNEEFEVLSIGNGKVISISKDDITGTTIKIKHENDLISVYQSVKDTTVKENEEVKKGQVIAKSGTNKIEEDLKNHLHFELYENNRLVNPEKYFLNNEGN